MLNQFTRWILNGFSWLNVYSILLRLSSPPASSITRFSIRLLTLVTRLRLLTCSSQISHGRFWGGCQLQTLSPRPSLDTSRSRLFLRGWWSCVCLAWARKTRLGMSAWLNLNTSLGVYVTDRGFLIGLKPFEGELFWWKIEVNLGAEACFCFCLLVSS